MRKKLFFLSVTAAMLLSCASQKPSIAFAGEWSVTSLNGQSIAPADDSPMLGFDTKQGLFYGFTGCNRLTGTFDAKAFSQGKADFSQLGMTRMLCQDAKYERPLVDALAKATASEISENEIKLKDKDGNVLLILTKKQSNANSR